VTFKSGSEVKSLKVVLFDRLRMVSYCCPIVTLSVRCTVSEIFYFKNAVTLKTGLICLNVIENVTIRDTAHDFLLMFYSNYDYLASFLRYSMSKNIATLKS